MHHGIPYGSYREFTTRDVVQLSARASCRRGFATVRRFVDAAIISGIARRRPARVPVVVHLTRSAGPISSGALRRERAILGHLIKFADNSLDVVHVNVIQVFRGFQIVRLAAGIARGRVGVARVGSVGCRHCHRSLVVNIRITKGEGSIYIVSFRVSMFCSIDKRSPMGIGIRPD
ncbi:hypothetical protein AB0G00_27185 [Nocardia salmonicida]|uniref:hypothetical protein n=1 Tax=Nocardia salmonicida TaxID=53431 RepID=UPI0033D0ABAA